MAEPAVAIIARASGSPHKNTNITWPAGLLSASTGREQGGTSQCILIGSILYRTDAVEAWLLCAREKGQG